MHTFFIILRKLHIAKKFYHLEKEIKLSYRQHVHSIYLVSNSYAERLTIKGTGSQA